MLGCRVNNSYTCTVYADLIFLYFCFPCFCFLGDFLILALCHEVNSELKVNSELFLSQHGINAYEVPEELSSDGGPQFIY